MRCKAYVRSLGIALAAFGIAAITEEASAQGFTCQRTLTAEVIALDQVYTYNRFGSYNPLGMMYALRRDVVPITGTVPYEGNVKLRTDKRPRPLVLRMNVGDCLQVTFRNWLRPTRPLSWDPNDFAFPNNVDPNDPGNWQRAPATRTASMHVNGLQFDVQTSDGSRVGYNASSLVDPGQSIVYTYFADKPGSYMVYSHGALAGGQGDGGSLVLGLFGAINVEPKGSVWYRSQLTNRELRLVRTRICTTNCLPEYEEGSAANDEWVEVASGTQEIMIDDGSEGGAAPAPCPNPVTTCGPWTFNYEAVDPLRGYQPVAAILNSSNQIVHSDLNAIIDQRDATVIAQDCADSPASGTCGDFREFTVLFHDELKAVQAFPQLKDDHPLAKTFHGVRDGFGVNYGASGAGPIILANFLGTGPAATCAECKYEEFFLESWPNGDPALLWQYADDPSNVHHSYLNDPVKIRNLHVGPFETHIFHLHAHQWLHEENGKDSTYLDSQTIGPGSSYTYEINWGGSGNRNQTPGDAIFHCHLYPHFAQGMWELWRVHDAFEDGSASRALPDKVRGTTPNPALMPMPGRAMAPLPTATFKGFPFYIGAAADPNGKGALAGRRSPQPPLELEYNGGLPRHVVVAGTAAFGPDPTPPLRMFDKHLAEAQLMYLDPNGTTAERWAMSFHAAGSHPSQDPSGNPATFYTRGHQPVAGAPYADPCPAPTDPSFILRDYRAAALGLNLIVHQGTGPTWNDPQGHINVLNDDVPQYIGATRAADPFFIRANSGECVAFHHTNLLHSQVEQDDFQILTPTDTIGQHIHLVKFDVTSSDGSGNGWNYEDGTFSPWEVRERIAAHNACVADPTCPEPGGNLSPVLHPWFTSLPDPNYALGAQTTIQRWWADPLPGLKSGSDRTIRTVFTHDHFGPSTIQHHGFYAALVIEPANSSWWDPTDTSPAGRRLGVEGGSGRTDGGPTLWQANIVTADPNLSYREFNLAFADFAIVYEGTRPVNPPVVPEAISSADVGTMLINYRNEPIPLRVSMGNQGNVQAAGVKGNMANVFSSRVHGDPFTPILKTYEKDRVKVRLIQGAQEEEHVFSANGLKWLHEPSEPLSGWYNAQAIGISEHFEMVTPVPAECPATRRFEPWDLDVETVATMDALYPEGDVGFSSPSIAEEVRVATEERLAAEVDSIWPCDLTAATTETVNRLTASESMVDDIREGLSTESLYTEDTSASGMAAMAATGETSYLIGDGTATSYTCNRRHRCFSDYLYGSTPLDDLWNGMWGILRGWRERRADVRELPNNPRPSSFLPHGLPPVTGLPSLPPNAGETDPCAGQTVTGYPVFDVHAIAKPITYNPRVGINDPTGLLFAPAADANAILAGTKAPEPLVMRAKGGECLTVRLKNRLPGPVPDRALQDAPMPGITTLNVDGLSPSRRVSMHPQLVEMNVRTGDGSQVGFNPNQTAGPNQTITYRWYVPVNLDASSDPFTQPLLPGPESLGGTNLRDFGDVIKHGSQGLFGGLMLEPAGASFANRFHNSEVVTKSDGTWFREFVLFYQDGLNLWDRNDMWIPDMPGRRGMNPSLRADPEDSGSKGFNYKTEPFWARLCPGLPLGSCNFAAFDLNDVDQSDVLSSFPYWGDPATPVFHAYPGDPFRFRLLQPDGRARQHSWAIHGHEWPHEPSHPKSMSLGAQGGISVARHFNVVPFQGAGGLTRTVGSYLYRDMPSFQFSGGLWGILRVDPFDPCVVDPASCDPCVVDPASCDPCAMDPALCDPTPCQVGRICYVY